MQVWSILDRSRSTHSLLALTAGALEICRATFRDMTPDDYPRELTSFNLAPKL